MSDDNMTYHERNLVIAENIVTEDHSRGRQRGDRCFYCPAPIGQKHHDECVVPDKRVRLRVELEFDVLMPATFTNDDITFNPLGSSSCFDNILLKHVVHDPDELPFTSCSCSAVRCVSIIENGDVVASKHADDYHRPQPSEALMKLFGEAFGISDDAS